MNQKVKKRKGIRNRAFNLIFLKFSSLFLCHWVLQNNTSHLSTIVYMDQHSFEESCARAAIAIRKADIFLLCTGAGFSADSGLSVFKDIANIEAYHKRNITYPELCCPIWLDKDPELFYGFFGKCFNDYRETKPHRGYQIIQEWRQSILDKQYETEDTFSTEFNNKFTEAWNEFIRSKDLDDESFYNPKTGPFFIFTSNVDGHAVASGFLEDEVYEIHGCSNIWQCKDDYFCVKADDCFNALNKGLLWRAPKDFRFDVDTETMLVHDSEEEKEGWRQHPRCPHCSGLSRPSTYMFGDMWWADHKPPRERYLAWEKVVLDYVQSGNKKLVILEVGCGTNIETVRSHTESKLLESIDICLHYIPSIGRREWRHYFDSSEPRRSTVPRYF